MRYIISLMMASLANVAWAAPLWADAPRVTTDIPAVQALVGLVMGDLGQPEVLLTPGASEHDFQLRPSQAAGLAASGLIVWIGPELTPWLDRAITTLGDGVPTLALLHAPGTATLAYAGDSHEDHADEPEQAGHDVHAEAAESEHAAEAGHDDHAEAAEAGHDDHAAEGAAPPDPHAWLDPDNARNWLAVIAAELARLDPANAATYGDNAARAAERIATMDREIKALLAPAANTPIVTAHEALGYFIAHYGLTSAGALAAGDAAAPGAARLAALEQTLAGDADLCLFPEPQHDPALLLQLADSTGARTGGALDATGSSQPPGPPLYESLMRALAQTIADCAAAG